MAFVSEPPAAANGTISTPAYVPVNGTATAVGYDGTPLTFSAVTQPANGTVAMNPDGTFTYTPNDGYTGSDSFTFKANDGSLDSNTATIAVTVTAPLPYASDQDYVTGENQPLSIAAPGLLDGADGNGLALTAQPATQPAHGTLALSPDVSFTYTPNTGFSGTDPSPTAPPTRTAWSRNRPPLPSLLMPRPRRPPKPWRCRSTPPPPSP